MNRILNSIPLTVCLTMLMHAVGCGKNAEVRNVEIESEAEIAPNTESDSADAKLFQGKSLDEWIAMAQESGSLNERRFAYAALRGTPLERERDRVLRVFVDALSDDVLLVRGLGAMGLAVAGQPTDPTAAAKLVEFLSYEVTGSDQRASDRGNAVGDRLDISLVMRSAEALQVLGEEAQLAPLRKMLEAEDVDPVVRQLLDRTIVQIETRLAEASDVAKADSSGN